MASLGSAIAERHSRLCPDLKPNGDDHTTSCGDSYTVLFLQLKFHPIGGRQPCTRQYSPYCATSPSLSAHPRTNNRHFY
jgi:hypothetical protein